MQNEQFLNTKLTLLIQNKRAHSSHPGCEHAAATNGGEHWCGSVRDLNYDSGKPLPLMSA